MSGLWVELRARARGEWFRLAFVALFAWLDWIMHRDIAFVLTVGVGAAVIVAYRVEIARAIGLQRIQNRMPPIAWVAVTSAPVVLYLVVRGRGESGWAGILSAAVIVVLVIAFGRYGAGLDSALAPFFRVRDRTLGLKWRATAVLLLPILIGFGYVHGTLADLPALLGFATGSPRTPDGLAIRFVIAAAASAILTFLLLRESSADRASQ